MINSDNEYVRLEDAPVDDESKSIIQGEGRSHEKTCGCLTSVQAFAICGMLCSMVHAMTLSILSISIITIASEFSLSWQQRGFILSAFSLTYSIFQIPGGFFVMSYGPYVGPFVACLGGFLSFATLPLLVDALAKKSGHDQNTIVYIFYVNMLFLGFLGAGFNPAFHALIAFKVKVQSRSFVHNTVYSGQQLGYILATVGVNISIDQLGWRKTFVIAGLISLLVGITWWQVLDRSMPNIDNNRGDTSFILQEDKRQNATQYKMWRKVLTNPAFHVICLNHFGSVWLSRVASNWGPTFLHQQEGIAFRDLGYFASIPKIFSFIVVSGSGALTWYLIQSRNWTVVGVRKLAQTAGLGIPALLLIWLNYETSNVAVIILLLLSIALQGLTFAGYHCNHIDIAPDPKMASLMYSITNTIGQISGVVEPLVDASILGINQTMTNSSHGHKQSHQSAAWSHVWFLVAAISSFCIFFWLLAARGVPLEVKG